MKPGFVLILLLIICGCGNFSVYTPSEKEKLSNEVIKKAAKLISEETGLIPCGSGGGALDQIRMLAISFDYRHEVDIASGRKLLVTALEIFRSEINFDEQIRPYLIEYPFQVKRIEIRIFIRNEDGSSVRADQLCVISVIDGILEYQTHMPDGWGLDTIYQETYEEALQKLNEMETACF